ncbi:MAG: LysR family transcriptional regulator, partial [Clostridiales bacterium]|nr:LysR family transcriptional regulator [Clostridiales bacterium]
QLVLKRVPYRLVLKELDVPAARDIGLVLKDKKTASLAVKRFLDYLHYR